ncbi:MoaD/ThiS family protein [Actinomyces sp. ZJ308]|uniref:MoaD/ThiS family protein n=1 Tax=Actinomyces sp. ZJ308 TaxID=2708342 RepID=UPI001FBC069B|nr:MoaD/ThiS family protein [Actinomyces sp. ZJ308]
MSPTPEPASAAPPQTGTRADAAPSPETLSVTLRYFAAAADAAGRPEERLDLPAGTTLAGLREQLAGRGLEMARVVPICSFLVNSVSTPADSLTPLADGDAVDVLPPFAGG